MGRNTAKNDGLDKRARSRIVRRHKRIRTGLVYFALLAICIGCLVMMPFINRAQDKQNTWAIQHGGVEIAPADGEGTPEDEQPLQGMESGDIRAITLEDVDVPTPSAVPVETPTPEPTEAPTPEPNEAPQDVAITVTAAGNCTFGGGQKRDAYKVFKQAVDRYGTDYFFEKVRPLFRQDDLTILNLEGPLTDVGAPANKGGSCYRGAPAWTDIMTGSGVELCSVANEHILDMGEEGDRRTAQALDEAGIGRCGLGEVYHAEIQGVRITALGFDRWNDSGSQAVEDVRRERSGCDLLIVNAHWGEEKRGEPSEELRALAHALIDAGADLVIGTHPHVFGGVERYNGKYICYSLGDFCNGADLAPADPRAMIFQQTFVITPGGSVRDGGINILPCRITGDARKNDYQPTVLEAREGAALLKGIARASNLGAETLWMADSYPESIGLIAGSGAAPEETPVPEEEESLVGTEFAEPADNVGADWEEVDGADLSLEGGEAEVPAA